MKGFRLFLPIATMAFTAGASAQKLLDTPIHGVLESYFFSTRLDHGAVHKLTWGEFYYRPTEDIKVQYSFGVFPVGHITDEAYVSYDKNSVLLRAGRMRTTFGFNDWANLFYNGFNSLPLVRLTPLSDGIALTRQDSGVEATTSIGDAQIEVATVDTTLRRDQITPDSVDTGIIRVQLPAGPFIVGLDALHRLRHDGAIYGTDVRYTAPRIVARLEFFGGDGHGSGQGGYVDVQYRVPKFTETQLVARSEYLKPGGGGDSITRQTVGVRQIVCRYLQLNANYAWGHNLLVAPSAPAAGLDNFSLRAMFQLKF